ncbi:coiled-coil domain-containing protein 89-like [Anthonomus grandis grandis]|uniref:coiled-coil domain-containing protein 89-like n=1 Tax=Anthonomus grandis grandis TaxID=2921223 RepID=UPI002165262B|nr:coiled-coil domain-containing protein 89-like [Anthonomus grandis grandis]
MSGQNLRSRDGPKSATSAIQKIKKSGGDQLEATLRYTAQLEKENNTLRAELHELAIQNDTLLRALDKNKDVFENDFNKLQNEIMANEKELIENSRRCVQQQKKYQEEIVKLKQENESLINQKSHLEQELTEKFKSLESEVKLLQLENENLKGNNKEFEDRCLRYKSKLRQAVKIVNELNHIVAQYKSKPENVCETTQTENVVMYHEKPTMVNWPAQCGDAIKTKTNSNTENMLLSDIFFKPKSFMDSEIDLFAVKSRSKSSLKNKPTLR